MERVRFFVESKWGCHLLSQWVTSIAAMVHLGLGLAILVGGHAEFVKPTYDPLVDMVNGQTWVWGLSIIVFAAMMITPFKWIIAAGLWLGMFWMFMWTALFGYAVVQYDDANAIPMILVWGFAMIDAALLIARLADKNEG